MNRSRYIAQAGLIAAVYAAATLITQGALQVFAWGPVQFRLSEAVTVLAAFTPAAIPGLTIGSVIANLYTVLTTGNPIALLDVVFGSLGTLLGAVWMWRFRARTAVALLGPVLSNALIVPAYLPFVLAAVVPPDVFSSIYTLPVLGVDLEGQWLAMYLFGVVFVGIGQAVVLYGLGWPLLAALRRLGLQRLAGHE